MKVFIVRHEHVEEDKDRCFDDNTSVHISRDYAEKALRDKKKECIENYWESCIDSYDIKITKDIPGLFEISNANGCERDEIIIEEHNVLN